MNGGGIEYDAPGKGISVRCGICCPRVNRAIGRLRSKTVRRKGVHSSVLTRSLDFAGGRTATATGMITAATGLGGALITGLTGALSQRFGLRQVILAFTGFWATDILFALLPFGKQNKKNLSKGKEANRE